MKEPVLVLPDAAAYLVLGAPRGGRAHYQIASELLSAVVGRPITVSRRPSGRPKLGAPDLELGVSLSYRDGALLIGHSPTRNVGVDIEPDDDALDPLALARDHFAAREAEMIAAQKDAAAQRDLFLRLWTAKEAVLKATGRGVYDGLDQPDLSAAAPILREDAGVARFAASARVPDGAVAARRIAPDGAPVLYLGLAAVAA